MNQEEMLQKMVKEISKVDHIISELLDREQLAKMLSVSPSFISALQSKGLLLDGISLGSCKRWRRGEVMDWIYHGCPSADKWRIIVKQQ